MTEIKSLLIETPIDKLIDIVRKEKKITISRASLLLGVSEKQLEEWVRVLEEHGFVELRYPAIGEPEIILKEIPEAKIVEKELKLEVKKEKVEKKVKEFEKKTVEVEKKVEVSDKSLAGLEKELQEKLDDVEKGLQKLGEFEGEKEKVLSEAKQVETISKEYAKHFGNVKTTLEEIDQRINEELEKLKGHENDIKNLDEEREKLKTEITILDKEMHILRSLISRPIRIPLLSGMKKLFEFHRRKTEKIKSKKKKLNRKAEKVKDKVKKRKLKFKHHLKKMKNKKRKLKFKHHLKKMKNKKRKLKFKSIKYNRKILWKP